MGRYILGVNGGGTKTVCVLADDEGRVLGIGESGSSNYQVVGKKAAREALSAAISRATSSAHRAMRCSMSCAIACFGLAGVDRPADRTLMADVARELLVADELIIDNDAVIALVGATMQSYGMIVNAGTGSIAFGINRRGRRARAGGWGYFLGDEGSGYDIGHKALTAIVKACDGRARQTMLQPLILQELKLKTVQDLIPRFYSLRSPKVDKISGLTRLVDKAARAGDKVAIKLLKDAGKELGCAATAVIKRLRLTKESFPVALVGGVLREIELVRGATVQAIKKVARHAQIVSPKFEPEVGAVLLGLQKLQVELDEGLQERLVESLSSFVEYGSRGVV